MNPAASFEEWNAFLDGTTSRKPSTTIPQVPTTSWSSSVLTEQQQVASSSSSMPYQQAEFDERGNPTTSIFDNYLASPPPYDSAPSAHYYNPHQYHQTYSNTTDPIDALLNLPDNKQDLTTESMAGWTGGKGSPVGSAHSPSGSSSSSLAGALVYPVPVASGSRPSTSGSGSAASSSLAGALIVPRLARPYQVRPQANPGAAASYVPHLGDATGYVQSYSNFHGYPLQQQQQQQQWSSAAALHPQSMVRSVQTSTTPSTGMASSPHPFLNASQHHNLALATQSGGSQQHQRHGAFPQSHAHQQQQMFPMHVNGPSFASPTGGHLFAPPMVSAQHQMSPLAQPPLYFPSLQQPQQQHQPLYGMPTPGSTGDGSPGVYWDLSQDMDAVDPKHHHAHQSSSASDSSSGAQSLPTPVATPASPERLVTERSGRVPADDDVRRRAKELIGVTQQSTERKRAVPSSSSSSKAGPSSKRQSGTFTFVGGPSKKEAAAAMAATSRRDRSSPIHGLDSGQSKRKRRRAGSADDSDEEGDDDEGEGSRPTSPLVMSSYSAMFDHIHIKNVPCPHPMCAFTAAADGMKVAAIIAAQTGSKKKGKAVQKPYKCPYVHPVTGADCPSSFRRRGCRDRHGASHSGKESKDVSDNRLNLAIARRLLWETCRVVEAEDWGCLYLDENAMQEAARGQQVKSAMISGEISSHQAAASVYVSKKEALQRLQEEFDREVLRSQAEDVKSDMFAMGEMEQKPATPPRGSTAVAPIDLDPYPLFKRLAYKRAATFERYFCPELHCEIDFTRLDALLRHTKNTHGEGKKSKGRPKGSVTAAAKRSGLGKKSLVGKKRKTMEESEDEWETDDGGGSENEASDDDDEVMPKKKRRTEKSLNMRSP